MSKQIFDPIHGFITITPLMQKIIDTPEYQRLRDLKQLGATFYVYPSATHTRFEHSLGVSHLAGNLLLELQKNQPELSLNNKTIDLVRIAGLIHDIGHGPFSHLYDNYIRNEDEPEHEERGIEIFKNMIKNNNFKLQESDIEFICNLINPPQHLQNNWLYQIICNKINEIDVDKIDYILRDSYHIGLQIQGEFSRLINNCRVVSYILNETEHKVLAWNSKLQYDIFLLFSSRFRLHKQVYTHHAVKAFEYLLIPILTKIKHTNPNFIDFTDSSILNRLNSPYIEELDKINKREIPIMVGEKVITNQQLLDKTKDEFINTLFEQTNNKYIYETINIGLSNSNTNPLYNVYYFDSINKNIGYLLNPGEFSFIIPTNFKETIIRLYTKKNKNIKNANVLWEQIRNYLI